MCTQVTPTFHPSILPALPDTRKLAASCSPRVPLPEGSSHRLLQPESGTRPHPALPGSHLTAVSEFLDVGAGLRAQLILIGPSELQGAIPDLPRAGVYEMFWWAETLSNRRKVSWTTPTGEPSEST